jgi:type I restriction enzyme M protein
VALKKSELYSSLWASCDELRGGMDASQYKDYVLVLLFVKYVSDRYADQPAFQARVSQTPDFAIGFWQSWRYEVQIVNSEIRQWRAAR